MRVRRRPADEIGLQIAPMCDVVFLILTFFMLTTELTKRTPAALPPVRLPTAPAAGQDAEAGRLVLSIDAQGRFLLGEKEASPEAVRAALAERARRHPPLRVRLRADAASPARAVKEAVGWSAAAGAEEVVIGAVSEEDAGGYAIPLDPRLKSHAGGTGTSPSGSRPDVTDP